MIIPFKPQFKAPILEGTKIHTIREDKSNRWKAGNTIQMATGVRTKNYECFAKASCLSTQTISIKWPPRGRTFKSPIVKIDGRKLLIPEVVKLAHNDGFDHVFDFYKWFNEDFEGKIIHWTDKRY